MDEEKKTEWEVSQTNETIIEKKTKFVVKYMIFVIILMLITSVGIYYTIKYIDENTNENLVVEESNIENEDEKEEQKKVAEDSKYAIKLYSETYDTNSLKVIDYYDFDGKVTTQYEEGEYESSILFVQIDGLKNVNIQNKINAKLKEISYSLGRLENVYTYVTANFSNVLSVVVRDSYGEKVKTLNIDLTTREEISFEKLFVSSAPIKSMIASGMYEGFAWYNLNENFEQYEGFFDMKNADTSEIEEQILRAVNRYDKIKNEIIFNFSPTSITIYNDELSTTIEMVEYANEIAIYKRYLTEESIYENDDLETKGTIIFTENISKFDDYAQNISYGKITNNIFVEEILFGYDYTLQKNDIEIITDYVNKLSTERKAILKKESPNNKGVIFQGEYHVFKDEHKGYYSIHTSYYKAECSLSYFKDEAFKDYIEVKGKERADAGLNAFATYMQEDYPEMQISEAENKTYYLSPTGEFLGNTIEEVESKTWE